MYFKKLNKIFRGEGGGNGAREVGGHIFVDMV